MSEQEKIKGLPVAGYRDQDESNVKLVNINKNTEESVLRMMDLYSRDMTIDQRWLSIARSHIEQGFMAMNRAIFQPQRIKLPHDE